MDRFLISTRVAVLAALLSGLLVLVGGIGLWGVKQSNQALEAMHAQRMATVVEVGQIQALLLQQRLLLAVALVTPDPQTIQSSTSAVEANIEKISRIWASYLARPQQSDDLRAAQTLYEHRSRFVEQGLKPTVVALRSGDIEGARRVVTEQVRPLYAPVGAGIDALVQRQVDAGRVAYEEGVARYQLIRNLAIFAVIGGLLFAGVFAAGLIKGISKSLGQAVTVARQVAGGDLSRQVLSIGKDESAQVLRALGEMSTKLSDTVLRIREGSENVASASSQIYTGNHDLASRTEQQASALEETAAALEQLNATVQQNADSARMAQHQASSASEIAVEGGKAMTQVVSTMGEIQASSARIADIIGVIDGIAFQTNILALNAAVEAARAGEQGRGFAVVASEVRLLAKRSADAAKEIKGLISASVQRVDHGSDLVAKAGQTMRDAVTAIQEVATLITEISAASHEQSTGMRQIGEAVQELDRTTQQNAALVEELSAAARSLQDQAQAQVQAVAAFTLVPSS